MQIVEILDQLFQYSIKKNIEGTFAEREPRKEQTRMLDDARLLINASAAVAQTDIVDGCNFRKRDGSVEKKEISMELSQQKERFVKLYWGNKDEAKWISYKAKGWDGVEREIKIP